MNEVQLYIGGQRIDLFKDEMITISKSISDIKEVGKVFTDFTKTFSIPANKVNNRIFSHYYNSDIVDGFDARKKVAAEIKLNYASFRSGYVKLDDVGLENEKPTTYYITFYGSTVTLKDLIGEDKLSALSGLNTDSKVYNATNIRTYLTTNKSASDIVVPLITHTQRLYYDSITSGLGDGNLYYSAPNTTDGVLWTELKYAIRVQRIIEEIESTYGITFSSDFFHDVTNDVFDDLFLWLHRKKGDVQPAIQIFKYSDLVSPWVETGSLGKVGSTTSDSFSVFTTTGITNNTLTVTPIPATPYDVSILKGGVEYWGVIGATGTNSWDKTDFGILPFGTYQVKISAAGATGFTSVAMVFTDGINNDTFTAAPWSLLANFNFTITEQIPEMKIMDFLTGIFKMFNLVAYEEDGVINVMPKSDYLAAGNTHDITKYVDVSTKKISPALPYKRIDFGYEDTNTFLAANHKQSFAQDWAKEEYEAGDSDLFGEVYEVKVPFSHMKFERLYNLGTSTLVNLQWGWFVDDNQDPYFGAPLLFYPYRNASSTAISFRDSTTTHISTSGINYPLNALNISSATFKQNINFKLEINEYTLDSSFNETLFDQYYSTDIAEVFNLQNRLVSLTAYLPKRLMLSLKLNDKVTIGSYTYRINKMTQTLQTGKTNFELLKIL